jgi:CRP-like cAMP-binding protein
MSVHEGRFAAAASPELLRVLRDAGRGRRFFQGDEIAAAGLEHLTGSIVVIRSGFMATVAIAESGQKTLLAIHGPGDLVGAEILFGAPKETLARVVTAMSGGSAAWVRPERFRAILDGHPQGWTALAQTLHERVTAAEERLCLMAGANADRRLAVFLLQLLAYGSAAPAGREDVVVPLPLSQAEMAEWVGAARETVERVLSRWRWRGMVHTSRRSVTVRNLAKLEEIAAAGIPRAA